MTALIYCPEHDAYGWATSDKWMQPTCQELEHDDPCAKCAGRPDRPSGCDHPHDEVRT